MIDFLRPLLFPITVCTIVSCVWAMAWDKSVQDEADRANRPTMVDRGEDPSPDPMPAPHARQVTASIRD